MPEVWRSRCVTRTLSGTWTPGSRSVTRSLSSRRPSSTSCRASAAVKVLVMLAMANGELPSSRVSPSRAQPLAPVQPLVPWTDTPIARASRPKATRARWVAACSAAACRVLNGMSSCGRAVPDPVSAPGGSATTRGSRSMGSPVTRGGAFDGADGCAVACGCCADSTAPSGAVVVRVSTRLRSSAATRASDQPAASRSGLIVIGRRRW